MQRLKLYQPGESLLYPMRYSAAFYLFRHPPVVSTGMSIEKVEGEFAMRPSRRRVEEGQWVFGLHRFGPFLNAALSRHPEENAYRNLRLRRYIRKGNRCMSVLQKSRRKAQ